MGPKCITPDDTTKPSVLPASTVATLLAVVPPKQRMSALLTSETPPLSRELVVLVRRTESQSEGSGWPFMIRRGNLSVCFFVSGFVSQGGG